MVEVREMLLEDLEKVAQIEQETFSMPWSAKGFADSLKQDCTYYLVARKEGKIVGYCGYLRSFEEADITNVAVDKEHRGLGIAEYMLTRLLEDGKADGVEAFTLEVRKSNEPALGLYRKLGFEEAGIRKNFYEEPREDAVIMWKRR